MLTLGTGICVLPLSGSQHLGSRGVSLSDCCNRVHKWIIPSTYMPVLCRLAVQEDHAWYCRTKSRGRFVSREGRRIDYLGHTQHERVRSRDLSSRPDSIDE